MEPLHNPLEGLSPPLEGLSPALYVATLSEIAHADGLHPAERELIEQHAEHFGVDLDNLPAVPHDLSSLPRATRVHAGPASTLTEFRCRHKISVHAHSQ